MSKLKTSYVCQKCGNVSSTWSGQCSSCGEWNTIIEEVVEITKQGLGGFGKSPKSIKSSVKLVKLSSVSSKDIKRLSCGIGEFDRVLGGGFVPGQVVLLAGEPGVGKSTVLTEISKRLSGGKNSKQILYVCGEESVEQIKIRALRMGYEADNLLMLSQTNLEQIESCIYDNKDISLVIVDSIQTLYSEQITGLAGSLPQVRGCTQVLTSIAKSVGVPVVLVGHVTKEGVVAGPKVLEHIVDTVLYLEGDSNHMFRILRTNKNRFGPVSEVGIFMMEEKGLIEVVNPSEMFLEQRVNSSGSCVSVVMEGFRPILFEVQALTVKTSFGYPKRTTSGFNSNRLQVLLATLEKRTGLKVSNFDVYLSIAGGFKVNEYAVDLAVCMAIASSISDKPIKDNTVVFGEVGLNGEVRKVSHLEKRISEANKLGYSNVICPKNCRSLKDALDKSF